MEVYPKDTDTEFFLEWEGGSFSFKEILSIAQQRWPDKKISFDNLSVMPISWGKYQNHNNHMSDFALYLRVSWF